LGELDGVLALREPRILRDFWGMRAERRRGFLDGIRKLHSRTFAANELALVKATSFVSEIAAELVRPGERALFLYADPRTYIATILAGPNSLKEQAARATGRRQRMAARVRGLGAGKTPAEIAAEAWACEMTALEAAAAVMGDRQVMWASFDALLADMTTGLSGIARFFGFAAPHATVRAIATGPLMSRYSKALEYEYSPSLRRELIAQEVRLQGRDIDDAMAMLERGAAASPLLAAALERSAKG
jgi:hypothetical protein